MTVDATVPAGKTGALASPDFAKLFFGASKLGALS